MLEEVAGLRLVAEPADAFRSDHALGPLRGDKLIEAAEVEGQTAAVDKGLNAILQRLTALLVFQTLVIVVLHGLNPSCRRGNLVEVEEMGVEDLVEVDVAIVAGHDESLRLYLLDDCREVCEVVGRDLRCLVEQDDVAEFDLLDHETGEIFFAMLLLEVVAESELISHAQCVDDGDDGIEASGTVFHG